MPSQKKKMFYPRHTVVVKNEAVKVITNSITGRIMHQMERMCTVLTSDRSHLWDLVVDGTTILKPIFKKQEVKWTGFVWLRGGTHECNNEPLSIKQRENCLTNWEATSFTRRTRRHAVEVLYFTVLSSKYFKSNNVFLCTEGGTFFMYTHENISFRNSQRKKQFFRWDSH